MRTTLCLQGTNKGGGPRQKDGGGEQRQTSRCPSCNREYDAALLLPCSHTLCARCVAAGECAQWDASRGGATLPVCAVMCPCCHRLVELPCWEWASAARCLPRNPTLSPGCVSETSLTHLQANTHCRDVGAVTEQRHLYVSSEATSSRGPADGTIDLQEEEMEQSVLGLCFALDPSRIPPSLRLSSSSLTVSFQGENVADPLPDCSSRGPTVTQDPEVTLTLPFVGANVVITRGQYYWEVDVCNSAIYMIGVTSLDSCGGWWLERRGMAFWSVYDGAREPLHAVPPWIKTLGIFLNMGGGVLSFHNPLTQEHLATLPTRFSPSGVLPALGLGQGRLRLHCGLPPPPHVFLSRASGYRQPCGAGMGRWQRDVPFQPVRTVIQRFEQLTVSDSDSGLVSNSGSSCSTPASLPDPGHSTGPGSGPESLFQSGQEEQEGGAESNHPGASDTFKGVIVCNRRVQRQAHPPLL